MSGRSKRKFVFSCTGGSASRPPGFYRFPAIPGRYASTGGAERCPPLPGLAPESALRLHPCRALSSAPASTSVKEEFVLEKLVVVVDREK